MNIWKPVTLAWQSRGDGKIYLCTDQEYLEGPFVAAEFMDKSWWDGKPIKQWVVAASNGAVRYEGSDKERCHKVAEWWNEELARVLMIKGTAAENHRG